MLFPQWELEITPEQRKEFASHWRKNRIYLESGFGGFITAVSLFVSERGVSMSYRELNSFTLAVLPVSEDSELHVVPHQFPENNLREIMAETRDRALLSMEERGDFIPLGAYGYFLTSTPSGCRILYGARLR